MGPGTPPPPPDPVKTAQAQADTNKQTAVTQYGLNATNQVTPYGSLSYSQNGTWADGTPHYTSTQTLSPEQQQLYNTYTANQQKLGSIGGQQIDKLGNILNTPWDPNTDVATKLSGMQKQFLDPEWNTRDQQLQSQLANQGVTPGSEAYNTATRQFGDQRDRAYNDMYLNAYNSAFGQSQAQRNQPFNEISALQSGSQVQQPNFTNTPQSNISSPDLAGMTYKSYEEGPLAQYQAQNTYNNALMGGAFGLAGAGLGGWASGGLSNAFGKMNPLSGVGGSR